MQISKCLQSRAWQGRCWGVLGHVFRPSQTGFQPPVWPPSSYLGFGQTPLVVLRCVALLLCVFVSACAYNSQRNEPTQVPLLASGSGLPIEPQSGEKAPHAWYAVRIRMPFNDNTQVDWEMDLLLAHAVLAEVVLEHRAHLPLWRFHRRAVQDKAGHQLSLRFYADAQRAEQIFARLEQHTLLSDLQTAGFVREVRLQTTPFEHGEQVSATSDKTWHPAIQKHWPAFIMGVSATWLGLIDELLPPAESEQETLEQTRSRYRIANEQLTKLWREQGQHAFLHHLNALFGYEPLLIRRYLRF